MVNVIVITYDVLLTFYLVKDLAALWMGLAFCDPAGPMTRKLVRIFEDFHYDS